MHARPGGLPKLAQCVQGIGDTHQRQIVGGRVEGVRDHRGDGALRNRLGDELMAVMIGTCNRDEEVAGLNRTAVDRDAGGLPCGIAGHGATGRRMHFVGGPENARRYVRHQLCLP